MRKNLTQKTILIIAILLVFVYGIFGIPKGFSGSALQTAILKRIPLGLDLKGGTRLVLQVHANEAVAGQAQQDAQRIEQDFQQNGITGAKVLNPDPKKQPGLIEVSGVPASHISDASSLRASSRDMSSVSSVSKPSKSKSSPGSTR